METLYLKFFLQVIHYRIELIDEQLESCDVDTVTFQPHSLSAVPDFNKLFHAKGIRLYTDVFSK